MEETFVGKVLILLGGYEKSYRVLIDCSKSIDELFVETEGIESKLKLLMTLDESVELYPKVRIAGSETERDMTFSEYKVYCGHVLKGAEWFSNYLHSAFQDLQGWMEEFVLKHELIYEYLNRPGDYEDAVNFVSELIEIRRIIEYSDKLLSNLLLNSRVFIDMLRKYLNDITLE